MSKKRNKRSHSGPVVPAWVPPGHPHDWSDAEADHYAEVVADYDYAKWRKLDDAVYNRKHDMMTCDLCGQGTEQIEYAEVVQLSTQRMQEVLDKPIGDMTDEEWTLFAAMLDDDMTSVADLLDGDDKDKSKPPCTCDGPGSEAAKWPTHISRCPQYSGEAYQGYGGNYGKYSGPSCKHDRTKLFKLEDGLSIFASASRDVKWLDDDKVDIGVYLSSNWERDIMVTPGVCLPFLDGTGTQGVYLDWPDYGVPSEPFPIAEIVDWMLEQMKGGKRLETGCMGGHGRTGTMLSLLLVRQGLTPPKAIAKARAEHCDKAVESGKQMDYVASFYKAVWGNEDWAADGTEDAAEWDKMKPSKSFSTGYTYTPAKNSWFQGSVFDKLLNMWVPKGGE